MRKMSSEAIFTKIASELIFSGGLLAEAQV